MPELLIARKINSFDEVVKASIIGKKKKFHNLIRTDMNDIRFIHRTARRRMPFANAYSSLAISAGMFWRVSPKAMTSHCLLLSLALPRQNMDMRPSRKWKVLI